MEYMRFTLSKNFACFTKCQKSDVLLLVRILDKNSTLFNSEISSLHITALNNVVDVIIDETMLK